LNVNVNEKQDRELTFSGIILMMRMRMMIMMMIVMMIVTMTVMPTAASTENVELLMS